MALRCRGYLPHLEFPNSIYFVTFRLAGLKYLFSSKVEKYLDQHYGSCWLKQPAIAQVVTQTLKHLDGTRYILHAWCIMPNHVPVVFTTISQGGKLDSDLIPILQCWKSVSAHKANKILNRTGPFWQGHTAESCQSKCMFELGIVAMERIQWHDSATHDRVTLAGGAPAPLFLSETYIFGTILIYRA